MKIIVTGGSGFLGSHIADALSDDGHEVTILDQKKSQWLRSDQNMVCADILDEKSVHSAVNGCDAIYHLAAVADIVDSISNPRKTLEINVMGTLNLLDIFSCRNTSFRQRHLSWKVPPTSLFRPNQISHSCDTFQFSNAFFQFESVVVLDDMKDGTCFGHTKHVRIFIDYIHHVFVSSADG